MVAPIKEYSESQSDTDEESSPNCQYTVYECPGLAPVR